MCRGAFQGCQNWLEVVALTLNFVDKRPCFPFVLPLFLTFHTSQTSPLMIKIRLQRHGAKHAPFYRMVVAPSTTRRDGKFIEVLGTYNPQAHIRTEELKLKMDRIDHWLGVGAQPTDTAKSLIKQGRLSPEEWLERAEKKAAAKLVTTNSPGKHGGHDRVPEGAARGGTAEQSPQARQTGRPGTGQEKENKPRATKNTQNVRKLGRENLHGDGPEMHG